MSCFNIFTVCIAFRDILSASRKMCQRQDAVVTSRVATVVLNGGTLSLHRGAQPLRRNGGTPSLHRGSQQLSSTAGRRRYIAGRSRCPRQRNAVVTSRDAAVALDGGTPSLHRGTPPLQRNGGISDKKLLSPLPYINIIINMTITTVTPCFRLSSIHD